jgi:hypothetical protein
MSRLVFAAEDTLDFMSILLLDSNQRILLDRSMIPPRPPTVGSAEFQQDDVISIWGGW